MHIQKRKVTKTAEKAGPDLLDVIKRRTITSLFSDDDLLELLVLKGGNAMDVVYQVSTRASVDVDFSVAEELDIEAVGLKVQTALEAGFSEIGYLAFDIKIEEKPKELPVELAGFWGGYKIVFKLISLSRAKELGEDLELMRREALMIGKGPRFEVDISRHEYIDDRQVYELDDYTIYVYSPAMIVCEKLRAICQQMPEYAEIVKARGLGKERARDFFDIETLIRYFSVDLGSRDVAELVKQMFHIKRVPLYLLSRIPSARELHATGYDAVRATIKPGVKVEPFDHYFDFVVEHVKKLEPLWDK